MYEKEVNGKEPDRMKHDLGDMFFFYAPIVMPLFRIKGAMLDNILFIISFIHIYDPILVKSLCLCSKYFIRISDTCYIISSYK